MKNIVLFSAFFLLAFAGMAQTSKTDLLVNNVWKIQSDEMSGLGVHTSLPENIELTF